MAKVKKGRSRKVRPKTGAKAARARRATKTGRRTSHRRGQASGAGAASKRVAALEAENRGLREELAALRAQLAERPPSPATEPDQSQTALDL